MLAIVARSLLALAAAAGPKSAPAPTAPAARPLTLVDVQGLKLKTLQELSSITGISSSRMVTVGNTSPRAVGPVSLRLECPAVVASGMTWWRPTRDSGCEARMGFWVELATESDADYLVQCSTSLTAWRFRYYNYVSRNGAPDAGPWTEGRTDGTGDALFYFRARDTHAAIHVRPELPVPWNNRDAALADCQVVRIAPLTTPKG